MSDEPSDYERFRGKCREMSEAAVKEDPTLRLVRGHYLCWEWGSQEHWWTVRADGTIHDPTKLQFPSKGDGEYVEFNGIVYCAECGKDMKEEDVKDSDGHYAFCSGMCHGRFVGVY